MPRRRWRESVKSFFGSHIDPEKDEELKGTKAEYDDKVHKILKDLEEDGKGSVANLIEDFHSHYQSLFARYDHLTQELRKNAHGKGSSSSSSDSSDSDSDDESSTKKKKKKKKNGKVEDNFEDQAPTIKHELEMALSEVADLKKKMTLVIEEKESLHQDALVKGQAAEKIAAELNAQAETWKDTASTLSSENANLMAELERSHQSRDELKKKLEDTSSELESLKSAAKEAAAREFEEQKRQAEELSAINGHLQQEKDTMLAELEGLKGDLSAFKEKFGFAEDEILKLTEMQKAAEEENTALSAKIAQLQDEIKQSEDRVQHHISESSQLSERMAVKERELSSHLEIHEAHKEEANKKLESAEKEMASLSQMHRAVGEEKTTLSLKVSQLENDIEQAESKIQHLVNESSELNRRLAEKESEFSSHLELHEAHREQTATRLRNLELELDSSHAQRREADKQKNDELSSLYRKLSDQEKDALDRINSLTSQVESIQAEAEALRIHKRELEEQTLRKGNEASAQIEDLTNQVSAKHKEFEDLLCQKMESEMQLEKRVKEISEFLIRIEDLKEELASKNSELSSNIEEKEALQLQVTDLELELNTARGQKQELEQLLKEKGQELSESKFQADTFKVDLEKGATEQRKTVEERESLILQVKDLNLAIDTIGNEKHGLEEQLRSKSETLNQLQGEKATLTADLNALNQKVDSLTAEKSEADLVIDKMNREISELQTRIRSLTEEVSSKTGDGERALEEKEVLALQLNNLMVELKSVGHEKRKVDDQIRMMVDEQNQLREEKESLLLKISELEKTVAERENDKTATQNRLDELHTQSSKEIAALGKQVESLQKQLEVLQFEKSQLEVEIERGKQETAASLALAESSNSELTSKIVEQQGMLKEWEDKLLRLCKEHEQQSEEDLKSSAKRMEEIRQQYHAEIVAKDEEVNQMEENIEDLKRELEMKADEISSLVENVSNLEVKQRLTSQKLRITEQLLSEKDESHQKKEEKLREEQKLLEEKNSKLSGAVAAYREAQARVAAEVAEKVNGTLNGIDALHTKFEEDFGRLESRICETINEVTVTGNGMREAKLEKEEEMRCVAEQLRQEKGRGLALGRKVEEAERALRGEKERLEEKVQRLERALAESERRIEEKEAGLSEVSEAKREAIRQLCLWVEYHRDRYEDLLKGIAAARRGPQVAAS
ncbi:COP1-interactive protein 1 [Andrographis paniculata]|uniref:COP1-interactive protein 1 n=1 Tax=Andrographis paniculata TaxID=175694 RepID=UPI0021E98F2E|nr:COP1-interactive protein 1 [Andrographis paniculata]XP_051119630.1 COP1-interactive protein 1 [Andrographis paniculata]XP_051119631.1 COP1-interactive protein 1 [Andrographis paniculata]